MKVLITGAAGFVGSHLVDACLAKGQTVRVIVRESSDLTYLKTLGSRIEIVSGDLQDAAAVDRATRGIDVIHHPAGRVTDVGSYADFFGANVLATRLLLSAARKNRVPRFVFVSSPSIFSEGHDHLDCDESLAYPKRFANYYAETKAISEQDVLAANSPDMITCSLRPRGIWGLRDKTGFLPKLLSALQKGKLKNLAPGKRVMASLCHVHNIAEACLLAAESNRVAGQAYFICDREAVSVWELIDRIGGMYGLGPVQGEVNPKVLGFAVAFLEALWMLPGMKKRYAPPLSRYSLGLLTLHSSYSIAKAQRDFAYPARVTLEQGLKELKAWTDANGGLEALLRYV